MSLLSRFGKDASGNVGLMFGFIAVPMIGIAGVSVDYARASSARASLSVAVDSAALMVARDAAKLTDAQLKTRAEALIRANLAGNSDAKLDSYTVAINRTARTVNVTATTAVDTSLTKVIGFDTIPVSSTAQSAWGTNTIELALVLDNTGSMSSSNKMTELKKASNTLLTTLENTNTEPGQIRVSLVPFASQVRLPNSYRDESWLKFTPSSTDPRLAIKKADWNGCISDRDEPYDIKDGTPSADTATRYPGANCESSSLSRVQPLTTNWASLRSSVSAMTPAGCTNITAGVVWGAATLSPGAPFSEAAPANTPRLTKYMIVLTDGNNTMNRFISNRNCWDSNSSVINPKTRSACDDAKAAGIKIYTIRVIEGDRNLLKQCASEPEMYREVSNASQLDAVFQQIAQEISQIRLTM